ncbi:MAG: RcpC/CpaB family pilus assembly protein [Actinomycetota bacterium]|nr:RcpC/CpaB family pilus assembly protein [Actinomycetota bacterium]
MKKKFVAALIAVALAAFGVLALVNYAQGANDRAFAGAEMVDVLQVQADIPAKTPSDRLKRSVKVVKVPVSARVDGALASLDAVVGKSTNSPLKKGEQLLNSRFGNVAVKSDSAVPEGYQEISISLGAPRLVTGKLKVGDRVGIIASYDAQDAGVIKKTNFIKQQQVLVTRVSGSNVPDAAEGADAPALITLAVRTIDAEKIVNASEFGKVWLTLQNSKTDTGGRAVIDPKDVLK